MLEIFEFDSSEVNDPLLAPYREQCYAAWKEIWNEEYLRLDPSHRWTSDTFTRQTKVAAIFYNGAYAASVLYRPMDLRSQINRDDSFLTYWPKDVVDRLATQDPIVSVCTSFTVAKEFRKTQIEGSNMKDVLAAFTVYYFKQSGYPLMIGLSRNTRKVNQFLINMGWDTFGTIDYNNEPSEMVFCRAESPSSIPDSLLQLFNQAPWNKKTRIPQRINPKKAA